MSQLNLFLLISLFLLLNLLLFASLGFYPFFDNQTLISKAINPAFKLPLGVIFICSLLNIYLIFYLAAKYLGKREGFFITLLYSVSPWIVYLSFYNSVFIYGIFLFLLFFTGLSLREKDNFLSIFLIALGTILILFISFLFWLTFIVLIFICYKSKIITKRELQIISLLILISLGVIFISASRNHQDKRQLVLEDITIFKEVGLINAVNTLQGENQKLGFGKLGRVVENKYSYFFEHFLNNITAHFVPVTYFTPQLSLLNFSSSTPIFLGFLIPFLFGLNRLVKFGIWKVAGIFLALVLPSVLAIKSPDLNRLVLVAPVLFMTISFGLVEMIDQKKYRLLLWIVSFLVLVQLFATVSDIYLREPIRLKSVEKNTYEVK